MMMEFYSMHDIKSAKKSHVCELCGKTIEVGEPYCHEAGKWNHDFFYRALHPVCFAMEEEYCCEVDNEFTWDDILEYVADTYCNDCRYAACNDYRPDYVECPFDSVVDCPTIREKFTS